MSLLELDPSKFLSDSEEESEDTEENNDEDDEDPVTPIRMNIQKTKASSIILEANREINLSPSDLKDEEDEEEYVRTPKKEFLEMERKIRDSGELIEILWKSIEKNEIKVTLSPEQHSKFSEKLQSPNVELEIVEQDAGADENNEESDDDDDDDSDDEPPPPVPMMDMAPARRADVKEESVKFLRKKFVETEKVKMGVIPKKLLENSIFGKEELITKSNDYFSDTISKSLLSHFKAMKKGGNKVVKIVPTKLKQKEYLIDSQKSLNASIILRSVNEPDKTIEKLRKSEDFDEDSFERIRTLVTMYTEEDKIKIKNYDKKKLSKLSKEDLIVHKLFQIPMLEERISVLDFFLDHHRFIELIKKPLDRYSKVALILRDSEEFKKFLTFVLGVTNFLNRSSVKVSDAKNLNQKELILGINIRSLSNLAKMKSKVSNENLLDLVYRLIHRKDRTILSFLDNLVVVKSIVGEKLDQKKSEIEELKSKILHCEKVMRDAEKNKKFGKEEKKLFIKKVNDFLPTCKFERVEAQNIYDKVLKYLDQIAAMYGQESEQMEDLFMDLNNFVIEFEKAAEHFKRKQIKIKKKKFETIRKNKEIEHMFQVYKNQYQTIRKQDFQKATLRLDKVKKQQMATMARKNNYMTLFSAHKNFRYSKLCRGKLFGNNKTIKIEVMILDHLLYIFKKGENRTDFFEPTDIGHILLKKKREKLVFFHLLKKKSPNNKLRLMWKTKKECDEFLDIFYMMNKVGRLILHLKEGRNLGDDEENPVDPYCSCKLGWFEYDEKCLSKKSKKTTVVRANNNPVWKDVLTMEFVDLENHYLDLQVRDHKKLLGNNSLGEKQIRLNLIEFKKKSKIMLDGGCEGSCVIVFFDFEKYVEQK